MEAFVLHLICVNAQRHTVVHCVKLVSVLKFSRLLFTEEVQNQ